MAQTAALFAPASIDRLRAADAPLALQMAGIVGFAALTAAFAQAELRIYLWEVPLTLQTVAVYASGLFLGRRNAALAMGLYLLAGLVLPVFAGGGSGAAHLLGLTGGYLLAMPLVAFLTGHLTTSRRSFGQTLLALAAGSVVLFAFGASWLHVAAGHEAWTTTAVAGWLRFVPWDVAKIALVASLYAAARHATR
ncbi:MAG: biotin transporter BioY [Rubricoccaceae bacterium]